ncbi:MAG: CDF family Co(II)/Ni(II) efflux transporter DmeF [Chitinispirillaceae bacterium]|nr:CDF family Co(II)/Ni(II) efflux transporter DmeF [Chitinispirillaceae bacterium]
MHRSHTELRHEHLYSVDHTRSERKIVAVVGLTALTMATEIVAGTLFGSMALVADGWHMGTHMLALGVTLVAYTLARRFMRDTRFAFGTWKIEILGGYTSALLLGVVGISMCFASIQRIIRPIPIHYDQALLVAVIGLIVNIASVLILGGNSSEDRRRRPHINGHNTSLPHPHPHAARHDLNLRAAYLHVVTDALTSILAIAALIAAKYLAWNLFDPAAGIVGAALILRWTTGLLKNTGAILLDREESSPMVGAVRERIESDGVSRIGDLHVWRIAQHSYACIIALVTKKDGFTIADFKERLKDLDEIVHVSVELHYFS